MLCAEQRYTECAAAAAAVTAAAALYAAVSLTTATATRPHTLQNIATSKAAMFDGLLPALAEALERASTTTGPTTPRSAAPAALRETAAQLRVACLKLIKSTSPAASYFVHVLCIRILRYGLHQRSHAHIATFTVCCTCVPLQVAPKVTPMLQRLCDAVARNGGEDKARAAADANPAIKGRLYIRSGTSSSSTSSAVSATAARSALAAAANGISSSSSGSGRRASVGGSGSSSAPLGAAALVLACLKKMPPPPPGHTQHETEGLTAGAAVVTTARAWHGRGCTAQCSLTLLNGVICLIWQAAQQ
eukprot:9162-Heterococcus_DN1.PRE.5